MGREGQREGASPDPMSGCHWKLGQRSQLSPLTSLLVPARACTWLRRKACLGMWQGIPPALTSTVPGGQRGLCCHPLAQGFLELRGTKGSPMPPLHLHLTPSEEYRSIHLKLILIPQFFLGSAGGEGSSAQSKQKEATQGHLLPTSVTSLALWQGKKLNPEAKVPLKHCASPILY